MAQQYNLKLFLRQAPNDLFEQYFRQRGIGGDLRWQALSELSVEPMFKVIEGADDQTRRGVESDFLDIYEMADEGGTRVLLDEARDPHHGVVLADEFDVMDGHLERAFWTFLNHPSVFRVAQRFHHADRMARWRKRRDLPPTSPRTDKETCERLAEAIARYYRDREGRGPACKVDHYKRGDRLYWFAYPEDFATTRLEYDDAHEMAPRTHRPAFEVVFAHDPAERTLDTCVRGDRATLADLHQIFGNIALGIELGPWDPRQVVYQPGVLFGILGAQMASLPLQPEDGVTSASVVRVRLRVLSRVRRKVTLEADTRADPGALHDLINDLLQSQAFPRDNLMVEAVTIRIEFATGIDGRKETIRFDVAYPNSCSLRYGPADERAKALLRRWGVDVSGRDDGGSAMAPRGVQTTFAV